MWNRTAAKQIKKVKKMHKLSIYESAFASDSDFQKIISRVSRKVDKIVDRQNLPERVKQRQDIEDINENFQMNCRSSLDELANLMNGFQRDFTLYKPQGNSNP